MATLEESQKVVGEKLELFARLIVSIFEDVGTVQPNKIAGTIIKLTKLTCEVVAPIAAAAATAQAGPVAGAATRAAINPLLSKIIEKVITWIDERLSHKKKSEKMTKIFQTVKPDQLRKMFVEAAVSIYYLYQSQFESVTDADSNWMGGLSNLAIDACKRIMSYLLEEETQDPIRLSADLLTKALIKGESKDQKEIIQFLSATKPRRIITCKPSDIYEKVGIKFVENNGQLIEYYGNPKFDKDFGYRWSFKWENRRWLTLNYTEEEGRKVPVDTRTSLKLEELEAKMAEILTNINKDDPNLQLDRIEDGLDTMKEDLNDIKTKLSSESTKSDEPKAFNVTPPVKTFTGRENELTLLHEKLQTQKKQVMVSKCASISGLGGMGKSELARKYAWEKYGNPYEHCIWIDSETESSITQSFHWVAKKLKIPIAEKSSDGKRNILDIVDDVYERFSKSKTLFIFDNVNYFQEIKDFLQSNLSPTDEKPTIIITSRNSDWKIGDKGDVGLLQLDQFTTDDALSFVKKVLEIEDEDKSHDTVICELTEELCYFPLALRQAASSINQFASRKSLTKSKSVLHWAITKYLHKFRNEKEKANLLKVEVDPYTKTTYATWQMTLRNIEENEANGPLAIRLVEVMAYLPADNIPLKGVIGLAENKEMLIEAVDILLKYSIITIGFRRCCSCCKNDDEENYIHRGHVAIHRLFQQVVRLGLQVGKMQGEEKGRSEEEVLKTALSRIYDHVPEDHQAALCRFACNYTTLIANHFCKKIMKTSCVCYQSSLECLNRPKPRSYYQVAYVLEYLVKDGDVSTIRKILNFLEGRNDWREISSDILNKCLVKHSYAPNDVSMEKIERHNIKELVLYHVEVFNALKRCNTKDLEYFLQSFDKRLIYSRFQTITALETAARSGNMNVVTLLVENGGVNNDLGGTLNSAIRNNHPLVTEYLFNKGFVLDDDACFQPLECEFSSIGKLMVDKEINWKPLLMAAQLNHVEIVKIFVNHEVYRSAMKDHGQTVCQYAARYGSIHVVKYFVNNKLANVNGRDCNNETLLTTAVKNDQFDIVKYLLSDETPDQVDINAHNVSGITPLFQTVLRCNIEIARLLIKHGAAVDNVQNGNTLLGKLNISVLHLVAACNCLEMIKLLVEECNADINMGLNTTFSPLQVAQYFNSEKVREFLNKNGADTTQWSEANLQTITCMFQSFYEENKVINGDMFKECNYVLCNLEDSYTRHNSNSSKNALELECFKTLISFFHKLEQDILSNKGEQN